MTWIQEHCRQCRIAVIALLIVAFMGRWVLERLYIPAEYECPIRLDDDFCGLPQPGISLLLWLGSGFAAGLVTGEFSNAQRTAEFLLISLSILLPLLPILGTLLLIPDQDNQHKQGFVIIFWILAIGFGLFIGLNNHPELFWEVWGIWLYIAVAVCVLILEICVNLSNRKVQKEADLECLSREL